MSKDKVIRTTFIISLVGHGLFLAMPALNINVSRLERPKELTLQIEIEKSFLLPKIEKMGEEKKLREVVSDSPKPEPERQAKEVALGEVSPQPVKKRVEVLSPADASSASTEEVDEAMLRYQDMVKQRIEEVRRYPEWAKEQRIEGVSHLKFVILANGNGREIKLVHSSGSKILDQEAMATIERASPFPPLPKEIASPSIQMEVSFIFTLK